MHDQSASGSDAALVSVDQSDAGQRLDAVAARLFAEYSRTRLQQWIGAGYLTVDGQPRRARDRLTGDEQLCLSVPPDELVDERVDVFEPEPIALDIRFEDEHIIVINKPAGLVMHPAPGHRRGTLLNALLHHEPNLVSVPRAGIVHRLDKDTSGLCVVARTLTSQTHLVRQLQERQMGRCYTAVVVGEVPINGTVNAPIGRHPRDRKRMAVIDSGKPAVSHFECEERYAGCARIRVRLETGRTHQIRVHMTHIGHALIGDPVYGRRLAVLPRILSQVPELAAFARQALHAHQLTLMHPYTQCSVVFNSDLPDDMSLLCEALQRHKLTLDDARSADHTAGPI